MYDWVCIMKLEIRALTDTDWESVRSIYLDGIATGKATFETIAPTWEGWNANHLPFARLVATLPLTDQVRGWAALSAVSRRAVYAGVAEVSVYVAADARGLGIGKELMGRLIAESERNGIWTLQAGIFPENAASIVLHKTFGFKVVGIRARIGKLNGRWRDTVLLERRSQIIGQDE